MRLSLDLCDPGFSPGGYYATIWFEGMQVDVRRTIIETADEERGFLSIQRIENHQRVRNRIICGRVEIDLPHAYRSLIVPQSPPATWQAFDHLYKGGEKPAVIFLVGEEDGYTHHVACEPPDFKTIVTVKRVPLSMLS